MIPKPPKGPTQIVAFRPPFTARGALLVAAKAAGCTCDPDIDIGDWPQARVRHDDWCALLRRADVN